MVDLRRANPGLFALVFALSACGGASTGTPKPDSGPAPLAAEPPAAETPAEAGPDAAEPPAAEAQPEPEPQPEPEGGIGPLSDAKRAALHETGTGDEDLGEWDVHYIKSNERRHDVWFPYIADLGGAYVGVGSDQNYTVMAAQKAEYALLLDIDPRIADLHYVYEALIEKSETPEELHARFDAKNKDDSIKLLEEYYADSDPAQRKRYLREYKAARETVFRHLRHVLTRDEKDVNTSWLSNPVMYAHVRTMYLNDRVRILAGDLTGPKTMITFGDAVRALGSTVRVLYLSNAEEYFMYNAQYRANIKGMPADERSLVLRTIYNKKWEHADALWNYQVQPLTDFQARMDDKKNAGRNAMIRHADKTDKVVERTTDVKGLSRINLGPPPAPSP